MKLIPWINLTINNIFFNAATNAFLLQAEKPIHRYEYHWFLRYYVGYIQTRYRIKGSDCIVSLV